MSLTEVPLLVPVFDGSIIPAGYRDATDAEILRSAADILDRRARGFGQKGAQGLRDMAHFAEALDKAKDRTSEIAADLPLKGNV